MSHALELKEQASFKSLLQSLTHALNQLEIRLKDAGDHPGWRFEF